MTFNVTEPWSYIALGVFMWGCIDILHGFVWPILRGLILTINKWSKS